ncbi:hypothetical protein ARMSODRAFT_982898 [Armillaria solidipes]|uniref:Uncharacterized protein n=1 Tax=Armillaria solidipes TaxID=1076256 RepID=A0A2H3AS90_9AGAR|nr:hypothetical protein ARMSODRAFT_982898 [Armillaria solidipes]
MSKRYKSAAIVDSDSDLLPVEEIMTSRRGEKRAPRYSSSPSNDSPPSKPQAKKVRGNQYDVLDRTTKCSSTRSPSKRSTQGNSVMEDVVTGKRTRNPSRRATEAAQANNLSSDEEEAGLSASPTKNKSSRSQSKEPTVRVEYDPDVTFKIGKGKTIKQSAPVANTSEDSPSEREPEEDRSVATQDEPEEEATPRASQSQSRKKGSDGEATFPRSANPKSQYDVEDNVRAVPDDVFSAKSAKKKPVSAKATASKFTPAKNSKKDSGLSRNEGRKEVVVISTDDEYELVSKSPSNSGHRKARDHDEDAIHARSHSKPRNRNPRKTEDDEEAFDTKRYLLIASSLGLLPENPAVRRNHEAESLNILTETLRSQSPRGERLL